jgi:hypothetical protein
MTITTIGLELAKTVFHVVGQDGGCRWLQTIPGQGSIVAGVSITVVGDGNAFRRGRDVSTVLGLAFPKAAT